MHRPHPPLRAPPAAPLPPSRDQTPAQAGPISDDSSSTAVVLLHKLILTAAASASSSYAIVLTDGSLDAGARRADPRRRLQQPRHRRRRRALLRGRAPGPSPKCRPRPRTGPTSGGSYSGPPTSPRGRRRPYSGLVLNAPVLKLGNRDATGRAACTVDVQPQRRSGTASVLINAALLRERKERSSRGSGAVSMCFL